MVCRPISKERSVKQPSRKQASFAKGLQSEVTARESENTKKHTEKEQLATMHLHFPEGTEARLNITEYVKQNPFVC